MSRIIIDTVRTLSKVNLTGLLHRPAALSCQRLYTTQVPQKTAGEVRIEEILRQKFKGATFVNVEDISGGCGSMYDVQVEAAEFKGKRTVMQHRMVNEALEAEIKEMHGLRINTKATAS